MRTEIKGDNGRAIRENPRKMGAFEVSKLKGEGGQEKKIKESKKSPLMGNKPG